jgi:Fe-S-cluster containining protein
MKKNKDILQIRKSVKMAWEQKIVKKKGEMTAFIESPESWIGQINRVSFRQYERYCMNAEYVKQVSSRIEEIESLEIEFFIEDLEILQKESYRLYKGGDGVRQIYEVRLEWCREYMSVLDNETKEKYLPLFER